jgi:WD40 repeat protein
MNISSQSKSTVRPVLREDEEIVLSSLTTLKEPVKLVSKFITAYNPVVMQTPFKGTDLKITKDGTTALFASTNGRLAKANLTTQTMELDQPIYQNAIFTLDLSKDEQFVFVGGANPTIRKFDLKTFIQVQKFPGHTGEVYQLLISPDSSTMFSCGQDKTVKVWDLKGTKIGVDVFTHRAAVQSIDLVYDQGYLMTGSLDQTASILRVNQGKWTVEHTIEVDDTIYSVKISPKLSYVAVGCENGTLKTWTFGNWEPLREFHDSGKVWVIDIAQNEEFIVSGGMSKNVVIWDMVKEREQIELKGHNGWIKGVNISSDQTKIISLSSDMKIMTWKIPMFEDRTLFHLEKEVKELWFSDIDGLLYAHIQEPLENGQKHSILAWNMINMSQVKSIDLIETDLVDWQLAEDNNLFYIIYKEEDSFFLGSYVLSTGERNKGLSLGYLEVACFKVSRDNTYLFIGQTYKIQTFNLPNVEVPYNSQIYHSGRLTSIVSDPLNRFILSADNLGYIKLIDVQLMANTDVRNDLATISELNDLRATIREMKLVNSDTLAVVSDKLILFWSVDKRAVIKTLNKEGYLHIDSSLDCRYAFFRTDTKLEIWTMEDFSYNSFIQCSSEIRSFHLTPDNKTIAYSTGTDVVVKRSPLATKTIYICGDSSKRYDYLRYMSSIIDSSSEEFSNAFDDWIIEPFHINTLHFYAYYNFEEYLTKALQQGAPFFCTAHGYSPLSIALELDYIGSVSAIIREIRVIFETNPFTFLSIESSLPALNNSGYERLHAVYDTIFSVTRNKNLPKFCDNKPSFPVVTISDSFLPKKETFESVVNYAEDGNQLMFIQSFIKVPLLSGTSESIDFLDSITKCKNLRIYDTKFIQIFLQQKWMQVRWVAYIHALIYVAYLVVLSIYTVNERNSKFLIVPFVFNCVFLLYEISYMVFSRGLYFRDMWNYLDLARILGIVIYSIFIWLDVYPDTDWFLAVILLMSWVRGVAFFRVFSFAIVFYALGPYTNEDGTIADFFGYATGFYLVNLGGDDPSPFNQLDWLFFVPVTVLNPIIMVNLLISILGDTYGTVKEYETVNDSRELISQILEAEFIMYWRRGVKDKKFIHMCDEFSPEITGPEDSLMKKVKALKVKIVKMIDSMGQEQKILDDVAKGLKKRNNDVISVIEKYELKQSLKSA